MSNLNLPMYFETSSSSDSGASDAESDSSHSDQGSIPSSSSESGIANESTNDDMEDDSEDSNEGSDSSTSSSSFSSSSAPIKTFHLLFSSRTPSKEDVQRQEIDEQIRELKSRRNALAYISRLPPEILSKVFLIYKRRSPVLRKWVRVTFVSQHWRNVALGCSQLWSDISPPTSARWLDLMLERSGSAPLTLVVDSDNLSRTQAKLTAGSVLKQYQRIRTLVVSADATFDALESAIQTLEAPAPMLETLCLERYWDGLKVLPKGFLAGEAPNLHCLSLVNWTLHSWPSPLLSNLSHLKILLHERAPPPPADVILEMLAMAPLLQELELGLPLPDNYDSVERRVVSFNHLHQVKIERNALKAMARLLRCLRLPKNASLVLKSRGPRDRPDTGKEVAELASALNRSWTPELSDSAVVPIYHISISRREKECVLEAFIEQPGSEASYRVHSTSRRLLHLRTCHSITVLKDLLNALPLSRIQGISYLTHLGCTDSLPLHHLPSIRSVSITPESASRVLQWILDTPPEKCFPGLKRINFISRLGFEFARDDPSATDPNQLIRILTARKRSRIPITKVDLGKCIISKKYLTKIRNLCEDLSWENIGSDDE